MDANKNMQQNYYCEVCDYECSRKSCWEQHLDTAKHFKAKNGLINANIKYACENCDKIFKHQSSYCRHKKNCTKTDNSQNSSISDKELIMALVKQNSELMDMLKNNTGQINNNTNSLNNNNNKTFNLNLFLNETCKDAMNIMDFVDSIKLQISDLEKVGEVGYIEGISNIITSKLKMMDYTLRPVHCTDKKRRVVYVKDENKWEKEDDKNTKMRKMINRVANKNIRLLPTFREQNPDYGNAYSKVSDKYNKIALEAMGGSTDTNIDKEDKIINNISKYITIEKYMD